jgi:hypothetical protein
VPHPFRAFRGKGGKGTLLLLMVLLSRSLAPLLPCSLAPSFPCSLVPCFFAPPPVSVP